MLWQATTRGIFQVLRNVANVPSIHSEVMQGEIKTMILDSIYLHQTARQQKKEKRKEKKRKERKGKEV